MPEQKDNKETNQDSVTISDTGKDIKEGMDRYESKMRKSAALGIEESAPPTGDSTRSEE